MGRQGAWGGGSFGVTGWSVRRWLNQKLLLIRRSSFSGVSNLRILGVLGATMNKKSHESGKHGEALSRDSRNSHWCQTVLRSNFGITAMTTPAAIPMPPPATRRWSYEELVAEVPESNQPMELWDGELLVMPAPSFHHQEIVFRFQQALYEWVREHDAGKVVASPIDMVLSPHRVLQPDVAFVSKERLSIVDRVIMGPADLVAEVISLEGRRRDRIDKRDLYEQCGIKEYWIIDPEAQTVEVLHVESGVYRLVVRAHMDEVAASRLLPGFEISASELFKS